MERLKDKPFALIGINSDGPREKVLEMLRKEGIPWRNAIDGDTSGPIATRWNVHGWPTIYILDAEGVIRHKNARGKRMDDAVETLLKELEERKK